MCVTFTPQVEGVWTVMGMRFLKEQVFKFETVRQLHQAAERQ